MGVVGTTKDFLDHEAEVMALYKASGGHQISMSSGDSMHQTPFYKEKLESLIKSKALLQEAFPETTTVAQKHDPGDHKSCILLGRKVSLKYSDLLPTKTLEPISTQVSRPAPTLSCINPEAWQSWNKRS